MLKEQLAYNQTPERTASILVDEASAVHKGLLYKEVFPNDKSWYSLNIEAEMGDLIIMMELLCEQCHFNFAKLAELGEQRFKKRMEEIRKGKQE